MNTRVEDVDLKELRKYCIDNHRAMWNWLADNPDKNKKDWPGWEKYDIDPSPNEIEYCFLCGYISADPDKNCSHCPLDWVITDRCSEKDSYFALYYHNYLTLETRTKYAKIIANLPEKTI